MNIIGIRLIAWNGYAVHRRDFESGWDYAMPLSQAVQMYESAGYRVATVPLLGNPKEPPCSNA